MARGFVLIEQMPCLKLNAYSITPENDLMTCLYKPAHGVGDMTQKRRERTQAQGV